MEALLDWSSAAAEAKASGRCRVVKYPAHERVALVVQGRWARHGRSVAGVLHQPGTRAPRGARRGTHGGHDVALRRTTDEELRWDAVQGRLGVSLRVCSAVSQGPSVVVRLSALRRDR
jgi:hypothetical protein